MMKEEMREEIQETGDLDLNGIHIMTIIGEIEGHQNAAQGTKTTKYEHMIPTLAKAETTNIPLSFLVSFNDCITLSPSISGSIKSISSKS